MSFLIAIAQKPLEDFLSEPVLTVACVLLILVALLWIVTARVIAHKQKSALREMRRRRRRARSAPPDRTRSGGGPTEAMRRTRE